MWTLAAAGSLLGPWVDRSGKRRVMLWCDGGRFVLLALLALGACTGRVSFVGLLLAAAASGVLTVGFELARSAWQAQRVAVDDLPRRNAQPGMVGSVSETAAFALGGWRYQWLGAALALAVDACSDALQALCLRGVHEVPGTAATAPQQKDGWAAALQALAQSCRRIARRGRAAGAACAGDD